jgi:GHMP kinases putative ATP-binding protein (modular protein)
MEREIDIFIPGRLCLFGEHSDWAATYREQNPMINKGYSIVLGIDKGVYLKAYKNEKFEYVYDKQSIKIDNIKKLEEFDPFFDYVVSAAKLVTQKYQVEGIKIICTKMTLPIKKGLASSAAICMAIVRAYNQVYSLKISIEEEMKLAYQAENLIGSKCGKLDQICAYGKGIRFIEFDKEYIVSKNINIKQDLYYLLVDLNSSKNTKKILDNLNNEYPFPKDKKCLNLYRALGKINEGINRKAKVYIETANIKKLGLLMNKAQLVFDKNVSEYSSELKAPRLHNLILFLKKVEGVLGIKGVGSQGDGMAQVLVEKEKIQNIKKIIEKNYNYEVYEICANNDKFIERSLKI